MGYDLLYQRCDDKTNINIFYQRCFIKYAAYSVMNPMEITKWLTGVSTPFPREVRLSAETVHKYRVRLGFKPQPRVAPYSTLPIVV